MPFSFSDRYAGYCSLVPGLARRNKRSGNPHSATYVGENGEIIYIPNNGGHIEETS